MQAKLQRRIQRYGWDRAAAVYEECWSRQLEAAQTAMLECGGPRAGEAVLDVACGTGLVTFRAAEMVGPSGRVTGCDLSEEMVNQARQEASRRGAANVTFARADAEELEFAAGFDVALCALGLMYFPDPVAALRRMHAALRPGGRAAAAVWGARENCGWAGIFPIVDRRVRSEVCPMFFQLGTASNQQAAFRAAGFEDPRTERIAVTLRYGSAEEACAAAFAGGPVALAYSRFDEAARREAHAEYLDSIAAYRDGSGYRMPGEFVITAGCKSRVDSGA